MREIIVIADTSCLISLTKIEAIHLLKELYAEVYVTEEVAFEFGEALPEWVLIRKVKDLTNQHILSTFLDIGRAKAKIGMMNLTYNLFRCVQLKVMVTLVG